jgi:hypothetical protein
VHGIRSARIKRSNKFFIPRELSSSSLQTPPPTARTFIIWKETLHVVVLLLLLGFVCERNGDLNAASRPVNNFNLYGSQTSIRHSALLQYYSASPPAF